MASELKNLSVFDTPVPSAEEMSFGIIVSEWNKEITGALLAGALDLLKEVGCKEENIMVKWVPGAYEITYGAELMCEYTDVDGIITLGCVIKGDTPHFEYICMGVTNGLNTVQLDNNTPIAFGVLTVNTQEQAQERAGGKHGNKGAEAAATAVKMVALKMELEEQDM